MKVLTAEKCGFCLGVRNAIKIAEQTLEKESPVYSLGPVIHNQDVVSRLADKGLVTVESLDKIPGGTVLIRSHGATKAMIEDIQSRGLSIVDATCVLVKHVQQKAARLEAEGWMVVIAGDPRHPEIISIAGHTESAVVAETPEQMKELAGSHEKTALLCQTTQSYGFFSNMAAAAVNADFSEIRAVNTLCRESQRRQQAAKQLSEKVDVMFVLGGLHSANTRKLAELCSEGCKNVYHLQNKSELKQEMLRDCSSAGITAGASTPDWVIQEFTETIREI
ncbi:4-hydroxy-3-methylbut-2-enyl diphosphate reductase [Sedimentisphaera salicampi]|uniref:4-hydroxy-3-methylbut-2-enyl diphosphate reductase n=1 Tax=Sedimentisphaera salicampi TaxID=1941349 RepID=A0A1W6LNT7_9BACT|nr:4-hydroxy-3-methylbut-2-enyl diphosphate reductase [Sedimentisphaera salicampi]ARN57393.1 4-hydroxy-3-methylbut-2-enyl diphosphate reductase [Sedimentisphaera salicampi]OXU14538.1 4-hydroxy-3-methylbut-2-enyl diphosphate reductase [Sedimentisphaera salicampi]